MKAADRRRPNLRHAYPPEDQRFPAFLTEFVKFRKDEQRTPLLKYEDDRKGRKNEERTNDQLKKINQQLDTVAMGL